MNPQGTSSQGNNSTDIFDTELDTPESLGPWGDELGEKKERSLRVYFQNVNGIPCHDNWAEWNHIITYLKSKQVDIAGLAETNIKWTKQSTSAAKRQLTSHINPATLIAASCDEPCPFKYQRGGVLLATLGKLTGRIETTGQDPLGLGRWAYTKYIGRNGKALIIISAYRVAQSNLTPGDNTSYNQQYRALRRQGVENPKPKKLFCSHLLSQIQAWTAQNTDILLMLDANDDLTDPDFGKFMDQCKLYDLLGTHHSINSPPTYIRGSRTIDYLLATENVIKATQQCDMNSYNDTISSDHRSLWADIDIP